MMAYRMQLPSSVLVGRETVRSAAKEIRRTAGNRVLLITESELADTGSAAALASEFEDEGLQVALYTAIGSKSLSDVAESAIELGRSGHIDCVAAFGSASTMGLGRLVAAMLEDPKHRPREGIISSKAIIDVDDVLDEQAAPSSGMPFVAVPSLPFDPLLCANRCIVVDSRNRRSRLVALKSAPSIILVDSRFLAETTVVQAMLGASAALLLAVEGLHSHAGTPMSTALFERVASLSCTALEGVGHHPPLFDTAAKPGRESHLKLIDSLRDTALLASIAASATGIGPGTAMCAAVHARTGLGFTAAASTLVAPAVAAFVRAFPESAAETATLIGAGGAAHDIVETRLRELMAGAGLPLRLRDIGVDERDIAGLSSDVDSMRVFGAFGGALDSSFVEDLLERAR
jgi:4-hydroxybutyrate dehydrogenase